MNRREATARIIPLFRLNRNEQQFLPAALEVIETPISPLGRITTLTIVAAAIIAILWSCFAKVDVIATAQGRIVPVGKTKIVQPLETGVVSAIFVSDGDHVRTGQVLVDLDSIPSRADRDRYNRDLMHDRLEIGVLTGLESALVGNKPAVLGNLPPEATEDDAALARAEIDARSADEAAKLSGLDQQIDSKEAEFEETNATIAKFQASLPMVQALANIRKALMLNQFGNKIQYYEIEQSLIEQQHEILVQMRHAQEVSDEKKSLINQRTAAAAEYQMSILQDLQKIKADASETEAELIKSGERLRLETLVAPIDGTVQQVAIHTIGGVVTPAEPLMAIVPDRDGLVVEAMVQNRDVGFVHLGQKAEIKIETFNFTRYGLIEGQVLDLTRDTVTPTTSLGTNDDGLPGSSDSTSSGNPVAPAEPSYIAHIALARDWMDTENGRVALGPGMAATAEIETGRRRVIGYLLSPLSRMIDESGHER